jgi:hypothetical protein
MLAYFYKFYRIYLSSQALVLLNFENRLNLEKLAGCCFFANLSQNDILCAY